MKTYKNVDEYLKGVDKDKVAKLERVRSIVRSTVPDAIESMAYGMPAYKWKDRPLFYFAAMKGHLGLYPTPGPIVECGNLLKDFSTSKGCIRVPYKLDISEKVIVSLLRARLKEIKEEIYGI